MADIAWNAYPRVLVEHLVRFIKEALASSLQYLSIHGVDISPISDGAEDLCRE
jgi:hypothetical protein